MYDPFGTLDRYYVVWQDGRNGSTNPDIFGVLVERDGSLGFPGPTEVTTASGIQSNPRVAFKSNAESFLVTWEEQTADGDYDIKARALTSIPSMFPGPILRISSPTSQPGIETINEFSPAVTINAQTELAQIVWADGRTATTLIHSETARDFKMQLELVEFQFVDGFNESIFFVEIFDFKIYTDFLDNLKLKFQTTGLSFDFPTHGEVIITTQERLVVQFTVPVPASLIDQVDWVFAEVITNPETETSGGGDPTFSTSQGDGRKTIVEEESKDADGNVISKTRTQTTKDGNKTTVLTDNLNDGSFDRREVITETRVGDTTTRIIDIDANNDTIFESQDREVETVEKVGKKTTNVIKRDSGNNGEFEETETRVRQPFSATQEATFPIVSTTTIEQGGIKRTEINETELLGGKRRTFKQFDAKGEDVIDTTTETESRDRKGGQQVIKANNDADPDIDVITTVKTTREEC